METVKKQADTIDDVEAEVGKARKQERSYEEAIDQLQHDLDALEQDNIKLKALANNPERQGLGFPLSLSMIFARILTAGLDICSACCSTYGDCDVTGGRERRDFLPTGAGWRSAPIPIRTPTSHILVVLFRSRRTAGPFGSCEWKIHILKAKTFYTKCRLFRNYELHLHQYRGRRHHRWNRPDSPIRMRKMKMSSVPRGVSETKVETASDVAFARDGDEGPV